MTALDPVLASAGLLTVSVITPGPNNFIVLSASVNGGWRTALPLTAGVVAGTQAVLLLALTGASAVFAMSPTVRTVVTVAGACYLAWLGVALLRSAAHLDDGSSAPSRTPASFLAMTLFQFVNPKTWVLTLAVIAGAGARVGPLTLPFMFAVIPALCLVLWIGAGRLLSRALTRPMVRRSFDSSCGIALVACAVVLAVSTIGEVVPTAVNVMTGRVRS